MRSNLFIAPKQDFDDEPYDAFLRDVYSYEPTTKADELLRRHARLVVWAARRTHLPSREALDLALAVFSTYAERHNPEKGRFSTYYVSSVRHAAVSWFRWTTLALGAGHVPPGLAFRVRQWKAACFKLRDRMGRYPKVPEVCAEIGRPLQHHSRLASAINFATPPQTIGSARTDRRRPHDHQPVSHYERNRTWRRSDLTSLFAIARKVLPRRHREIFYRRLLGEPLESIARDYDITRERVRQIVEIATNKLTYAARARASSSSSLSLAQ